MVERVALIGTGLMGTRMGMRLLEAGFALTVWNRTPSKADALLARGARSAETPAGAAEAADTVITMLSDGDTVRKILEQNGVASAMKPPALFIDMSSVAPDEARAHARLLGAKDIEAIDAPVSGGTKAAEEGTLAIMAGGNAVAFERARPVLGAMGQPVHVGPAGAGALAKLANQTIVAGAIAAVAEAMLLVERGGADPVAVRRALRSGFADSSVLQQHGKRMTKRSFAPGGPARLQLKDLSNILKAGRNLGLDLPLTKELHERFAVLCTKLEGADLDHSALFVELLARNGLWPESGPQPGNDKTGSDQKPEGA